MHKYAKAAAAVNIDAAGAAIPSSNKPAPGINAHRRKAAGTLIKNADMMLFAAAKTVLPHPKKNPLKQNTKGTNR